MNKLINVIILVLFSSCSGKQTTQQVQEENKSQERSFYTIDLSKDFSGSDNETLLLSDIVEDVEYVKLETTDDCLVTNNSFTSIFATDEDIYVLNKNYTNEKLFRFDRKTGKFISQIGSIGQGPKEMINPRFVFAKDSLVYVPSNISNKIYVYTNENQFVRSVPFCKDRSSFEDGTGETISVIDHQYIVRHPGQLQSKLNYNQYIATDVIDMNSNRLFAMRDTSDVYGIMLKLDWDPVRWYYKGNINFYNEPDRTVYAVTKDSIIPRYHFNLGDNKLPITTERMTTFVRRFIFFILTPRCFLLLAFPEWIVLLHPLPEFFHPHRFLNPGIPQSMELFPLPVSAGFYNRKNHPPWNIPIENPKKPWSMHSLFLSVYPTIGSLQHLSSKSQPLPEHKSEHFRD